MKGEINMFANLFVAMLGILMFIGVIFVILDIYMIALFFIFGIFFFSGENATIDLEQIQSQE